MQAKNVSLSDALAGPAFTVYGNLISDLGLTDAHVKSLGMSSVLGAPGFARIRAYRFGSGRCTVLPSPILFVVFGEGVELTEIECGLHPGEVKKWAIPPGTRTLTLSPAQGNVEDLLEAVAEVRGIDGGIAFENPRFAGGKLCADVHIWAKITVLGQTARFDQRIPVCIDVGQPCFTLWDIGFANLQICFRAPNQICGKLCVGKFGLEKCWEQCVAIPIHHSSGTAASSASCECKGHALDQAPFARVFTDCISLTIKDGKACLNVPLYGSVCVDVPSSVPNGTVAEACIDVCKKFGVPCGVEVSIKVGGQTVASQSWGCC